MPSAIFASTEVAAFSGGLPLVASNIYSGSYLDLSPNRTGVGGIQIRLDKVAPGPVYVGLPDLSGAYPTINSGGGMSSGGSSDGMRLDPGDAYFIAKLRLISGLQTPYFLVPVASSGARVYWEVT